VGQLFTDADGEPDRMVGVCSDITERKHAEERFRLAVEAAPSGMIMVDGRGIIQHINTLAEQLLGYTRDEIVGQPVERLVPARFRGDHAEYRTLFFMASSQRPMGSGRDLYALRKDGSEVPVEIGLSPIETEDGPIVLAAITDITERKRNALLLQGAVDAERAAKRDAEHANQLKDQFLATVSHELRAPLNAVLGWAEMLRTGKLDDTRRQRALEAVYVNAKRQTQLIDDLLDVASIMAGKMRVQRSAVDLSGVVRSALDVVQPSADAKRIDIETVIAESIGTVFGDAARLQQILWNLLTNGVKFTPDGGAIHLSVRRTDHVVEIAVTDNGRGIGADFLPRVFEPFLQADGSSTRSHGGLGLGLAIVKHLVEAHGGTVSAESAGEGHGSTFTVRLPIVAVYAEEPEASPSSSSLAGRAVAPVHSLEGVTVLVVDDDADSRDLLTACLEVSSASVLTAASAAEALEVLQRERVDALLADIAMPGEDGYALIRKVRALESPLTATIPAAALTSFTHEDDRQRALQAGFQLHLAKPIESRSLVEAVASLMMGIAAPHFTIRSRRFQL
jgi:PAS domain S-box-containing protein